MIVQDSPPGQNDGPDVFLSFDHICADRRVHLEALDAREAWPPLLRPGVLAGHGAYTAWEARGLTDFLGPACAGMASLSTMLASALCWTDVLRIWRQSEGSLDVLVSRPWRHPDPNRALRISAAPDALRSRVLLPLLSGVPGEWRPSAWPAGLTDASMAGESISRRQADAALGRYLATRLVGSWVAYQGTGLRSVAASLVYAYVLTALALQATAVDGSSTVTLGRLTSAIRAADWIVLHLLDRDVWARACSAHEVDEDASRLLQLVAGAARVLDGCDWRPEGT
ncbi:hypothetical protein LuPra_03006 [Luteitalea pratensis]|uniref:Urease accessory protein UreF n=1 Tax=Luteitalea pratensis TaxID=1855912 RepID=A0A143PMS3_LUTPR|nr:hypothetical protein [Luteitalea pratensis]AMY09781.1 hypothetical protein LuPra_03006 [Luteitalea pratensis]